MKENSTPVSSFKKFSFLMLWVRHDLLVLLTLLGIAFIYYFSFFGSLHSMGDTISPNSPAVIRITQDFTYKGEAYHTSYYTMVHFERYFNHNGPGIKWAPKTERVLVKLKDGSAVCAENEFMWGGVKYKSLKKALKVKQRLEKARFTTTWFDDPISPQTIIYDIASEHSKDISGLEIGKITKRKILFERIGSEYEDQAENQDGQNSSSCPILQTPHVIPDRIPKNSKVFSTVRAIHVNKRYEAETRNLDGWEDLPGGCRALIVPYGSEKLYWAGKKDFFDIRRWLQNKQGVWAVDHGMDVRESRRMFYFARRTDKEWRKDAPLTKEEKEKMLRLGTYKISVSKVAAGGKVCDLPPRFLLLGRPLIDFGEAGVYVVTNRSTSHIKLRP